jgi:hypothetical protein
MARSTKTARLLVRYGKHNVGETIRGDLAAKLIADGMATDVTPKPKKKTAPKTKNAGAAPENKGFDPEG